MYHITMFPYKFLNFWNPLLFGLNTNVFGNLKIMYFCMVSGMVLTVRGGIYIYRV
jgi:hypothetical protein